MLPPLLIYDGDCGFCRRWIARWRSITGDLVEYAPYQEVGDQYPQISTAEYQQAVQLVEPDGQIHSGAHAALRALAYATGSGAGWWLYRCLPGFAWTAELVYRYVARHRRGLSFLTNVLWGRHSGRPTFHLTRWLFVRALGVVYFIAFASLGVQIIGLVGANGILPINEYLERVTDRYGEGWEKYWRLPTLVWLNAGDRFLKLLCGSGAALSLLLVLRIFPGPALLLLWVTYLSLKVAGQTFLGFQWDNLLLEAGFLAIFLAPWRPLPKLGREPPPSRAIIFLLWFLLFRLMLCSGAVKLIHENPADPTWRNLTALNYHYETQCIPTAVAWYAHWLPEWFQKTSVFVMFVIELAVPFLIFFPRRLRMLGCFALIFLQVAILLTGNYTFFNWLTMALCLLLLDDRFYKKLFPRRTLDRLPSSDMRRRSQPCRTALISAFTVAMILLASVESIRSRLWPRTWQRLPAWTRQVARWHQPFHSISSYGLFTNMTTRRPEIVIEGSREGREWLAYEFKYKPGDPKRRPPFVAPHQPRLDWQMWFAALSPKRQWHWMGRMMLRLHEGSPEVLALLALNPFPNEPPAHVRAVMYDYHFADPKTRASDGVWWTRERMRVIARVPR